MYRPKRTVRKTTSLLGGINIIRSSGWRWRRVCAGAGAQRVFLHYQAKLDLNTKKITGVRRWCAGSIRSRVVPPDQFIPLAEDTGLIVPIVKMGAEHRLRSERRLAAGGPAAFVHGRESLGAPVRDEDLVKDIADALESSGMKPSC